MGMGMTMGMIVAVGVAMTVASENKAKYYVDEESDDAQCKHNGTIYRGRVEEAFYGEDNKDSGECPNEEDGDESAQNLGAGKAECHLGVRWKTRDCDSQ